VWSNKAQTDFEDEARKLFKAMNDARKPSLTPPDLFFKLAQRKIRAGHYNYDSDVKSSEQVFTPSAHA
jgi:hypothetical protein